MSIQWNISFGNILTLTMVLVSAVGIFWKHDARIKALEKEMEKHLEISAPLVDLLNNINATMQKLTQRLGDFPLHRHDGSRIMYPGDTKLVVEDND